MLDLQAEQPDRLAGLTGPTYLGYEELKDDGLDVSSEGTSILRLEPVLLHEQRVGRETCEAQLPEHAPATLHHTYYIDRPCHALKC